MTKNKLSRMLCILCTLAFALMHPAASLADGLTREEQRLWAACENGSVIRLHILANSDSPEDQQIKLQVRDILLDSFGQMLKNAGAESPEEVCAFIRQHLDQIACCASKAAHQAGFHGSVKTEFGLLHLPEKTYGQLTLPEGDYMGLRITIGSGKGRNWWCVLYPELCVSLLCGESVPDAQPGFHFDSLRIFKNWLLLPPL